MKKEFLFTLILLFTFLIFLSGCELNTKNNESDESSNKVEFSRTNLELNTTDSITNNTSNNNSNESEKSSNDSNTDTNTSQTPIETELATFSTTIIDKRENRQNNIRITCSKLNNLTVHSSQTFSFLKTIGETTAEARI